MTIPANARSQAVMHKLGMTRDPDADFDHPNVPVGHPVRRHWLWRLRAEDRDQTRVEVARRG
jgi:ribosomal-protein-alanine N-acetyltransferase